MSTAISSEWTRICQYEDLLTNTGLCALHEGEQVAIYKINPGSTYSQDLYAISNYDPIGKANVLSRGILGNIGDHLVVSSPLYKQHFDLISGKCLEDPDQRVKTYEIRRVNDEIQLKKSTRQ